MDRERLSRRLEEVCFVIAKAGPRRLRPIDDTTSHSPFPYDPHFMEKLRPDQVPRFLGCLTKPQGMEKKDVSLDTLCAIQDRVDPKKVEAIRNANVPEEPVVIRTDGRNYIIDGHHRATAAYLNGAEKMPVRFKDLTEEDRALK